MTELNIQKPRSFRSLTVTLAMAFLAMGAVILLISGSLQVYFNFKTQRKAASGQQQLIAGEAAYIVKSFIQEKLNMLEAAARFGNLVDARQEEQKITLEKLLGLEPAFRQLVLLNAQGTELLKVSRLSRLALNQLTAQRKNGLFSVASLRKIYIGPIYIDEITSEPLVIMAVPVTDVFGDFKGILIAEVNLKFMWDLVGSMKIGNKGLAYVVDRQGNLIAFGDISRVLKGENLSHLEEVNRFAKDKGVLIRREVGISKGIQNNYVIATYVPLGRPDWAVIVESPVTEAYEGVIRVLKVSVLIMFLSFILAIVAGIYFSRKITKPIISLRDAAVKIGVGKLDTQIEIKTKDEIGDLAGAFNQMTQDLQRTTTSIDNLNREITERKRIEDELKQKTELLEAQKEASLEGLLVVDENGQRILINKRLLELWKVPQRIAEDNNDEALLQYVVSETKNPQQFLDKVRYLYVHKNETSNDEIEFKNGKVFERYSSPVIDKDGKYFGRIWSFSDITERKNVEAELEKHRNHLEELVKEKIKELKEAQDRIIRSEKLAVVGQLASSVAHELRNPLGVMKNAIYYLNMLELGKDNPDIKENLEIISSEIENSDKVISDLLEFSRIKQPALRPEDINLIIKEALNRIRVPVGIEVVTELGKDLPQILVDALQMQQIFYNLTQNAIQAMEKGGILTISSCLAHDGNIAIAFKDAGCGILKENLQKIFEPLFSTKIKGTGLGLSVVASLVEGHGGKLEVESEVDKGSIFTVKLPINRG